MEHALDIVDAQQHIKHGMQQQVTAAMDAVGISSVILDEWWEVRDPSSRPYPFALLSNGWFRPISPSAQIASMLSPSRFGWIQRVERRDPELRQWFTVLVNLPGCRGVRIDVREPEELKEFAEGGYDELLTLAAEHSLSVSIISRHAAATIARIAAKFAAVQFMIDHCGHPANLNEWTDILALGKLRNVWLKWSMAELKFGDTEFPYPKAQAQFLCALESFSPERVVWASNVTIARERGNLSQLASFVRTTPGLSTGDMQWVLGGSARKLYKWPANH